MANLQYRKKITDSWADVPSAALQGTYEGMLAIQYPEANEMDGLGRPCGAIGFPTVQINATVMNACGMVFWQGLFDTAAAVSASMYLKAFNPRVVVGGATAWTTGSGYLCRPKYSRVKPGGDSADLNRTLYFDVEITINNFDIY
jgi:hypothetical protein